MTSYKIVCTSWFQSYTNVYTDEYISFHIYTHTNNTYTHTNKYVNVTGRYACMTMTKSNYYMIK